MTQKSIHDADALLIYRVGPVQCCSPTLTVESVIMPPHMTQTPGASVAEPGIFKTPQGIIKAVDLRKRFGVDRNDWVMPGRMVITEIEGGFAGMWVDEIMDVIQSPLKGWRGVPSCIPKNVFTRTLLMDDDILLYADFENLYSFKESGYLRQHIENLKNKEENRKLAENKKVDSYLKDKDKDKSVVKSVRHEYDDAIILNTESNSGNHPYIEDNQFEKNHHNRRNNIIPDQVREELNSQPSLKLKAVVKSDNKLNVSAASEQINSSIKSSSLDKRAEVVDILENNIKAVCVDEKELVRPLQGNDLLIVNESYESSVWGFVFVGIMVLAIGAFGIFALFPDVDESLQVAESEIFNNTNSYKWDEEKSSTLVDIEDNGVDGTVIEETMLNSDPEEKQIISEPGFKIKSENYSKYKLAANASVETNNYQADIMEDDEGVVIILSDPVEKATEIYSEVNNEVNNEVNSEIENLNKQDEPENKNDLISEDKQEVTENSEQSMISNAASNENDKVIDQLPVENKINTVSKIKKQNKSANLVITHIVVKGDTLWHIAMRYIHDPYRYPELARLSHIKNPDLIYPGDKVKIIYKK